MKLTTDENSRAEEARGNESGVKSSEQRILCRVARRGRHELILRSVENNDVLLMVRKAPELATATTPPGLSDPHAS